MTGVTGVVRVRFNGEFGLAKSSRRWQPEGTIAHWACNGGWADGSGSQEAGPDKDKLQTSSVGGLHLR